MGVGAGGNRQLVLSDVAMKTTSHTDTRTL